MVYKNDEQILNKVYIEFRVPNYQWFVLNDLKFYSLRTAVEAKNITFPALVFQMFVKFILMEWKLFR